MRSFPLLEGYRALAAFMVLTTHVAFTTGATLTPVVGPILGRMDFGVTVFFLLSGFLLYRPWARAAMRADTAPSIRPYAVRRAARIFPAYWVMVAFTLLVLPAIQPVRLEAWPVHLGMLHIYLPGFTLEGLTQTWSLATEVAFYALLPILAWVAGRRGRGDPDLSMRWQILVLAGAIAISWTFTAFHLLRGDAVTPLAGFWVPRFLDWFALGMLVSVLQARIELPNPPRPVVWVRRFAQETGLCLVLALGLYLVAMTPLAGPLTLAPGTAQAAMAKHGLYGFTALLLLLPGFMGIGALGARAARGSWWGRLLTNPVAVYLGTISYGVFLWHLVLLELIQDQLDLPDFQGGFWLLLVLVILASVGFATVSWFAIESPCRRWAHRVSSLATRG